MFETILHLLVLNIIWHCKKTNCQQVFVLHTASVVQLATKTFRLINLVINTKKDEVSVSDTLTGKFNPHRHYSYTWKLIYTIPPINKETDRQLQVWYKPFDEKSCRFSCKVVFLSSVLSGQTVTVPEQKNCKCNRYVTCLVKVGLLQQLPVGHPKNHLLRLKWVQNIAVRIVTQTKRSDHFTHFLCEFHWLPVQKYINHKIQDLIPGFLSVCHLQSSTQPRLHIPCSDQQNNNKTLGSRSIFQCCTQIVEQSSHSS